MFDTLLYIYICVLNTSGWQKLKFTSQPHLAPRLGMSGAIPLHPYIHSRSGQTTTSSILTLFKDVNNLPYEDFTS